MRPGVPHPAVLAVLALALAGCSAATVVPSLATPVASPSGGLATPAVTIAPSPTPAPATPASPFHSAFYSYTLDGPGWSGLPASSRWDGTGSPGDDEPEVDTILGPLHHSFAFGTTTTLTLDAFAAAFEATNASVHPCPTKIEVKRTTIDGVAARIDMCGGSVPAWSAFVVWAGRELTLVDYEPVAEQQGVLPTSFPELLKAIKLDR